MLQIFKKPHFKFMKYKYFAFLLSFLIIVAGLINIFVHKGLNFGVDFTGGTLIRLMFKNPVPIASIRSSLSDIGLGASKIQEVGKDKREYIIRTVKPQTSTEEEEIEAHEIMANRIIETLRTERGKTAIEEGLRDLNSTDEATLAVLLESSLLEEAQEIANKIIAYRVDNGIIRDFSDLKEIGIPDEAISLLQEETFLGQLTILSKETVGPQVGHDLRRKAILATVWALIGMLIYIAIRFRLAYGVSAILTLVHDVLVTLGIFSFTTREINLPVIAAIMTIVGYSLNDTIVIFDRVRDNLRSMRKQSLEVILDLSLNQTLSRSVITSGTTFLTVLALFLFGGEVINDFAFVMIIGVIIGSYSSIYQSCPVLFFWQKIFKSQRALRK